MQLISVYVVFLGREKTSWCWRQWMQCNRFRNCGCPKLPSCR